MTSLMAIWRDVIQSTENLSTDSGKHRDFSLHPFIFAIPGAGGRTRGKGAQGLYLYFYRPCRHHFGQQMRPYVKCPEKNYISFNGQGDLCYTLYFFPLFITAYMI